MATTGQTVDILEPPYPPGVLGTPTMDEELKDESFQEVWDEEDSETDGYEETPFYRSASLQSASRHHPLRVQTAARAKTGEAMSAYCQWTDSGDGVHRPVGATRDTLRPGMYKACDDMRGPYLQQHAVLTDDIVYMPEGASAQIIAGIRKFWASRDKYEKHGLVYKRGVLLHGPQGGGKTVTIQLLSNELIKMGGLVLLADTGPGGLSHLLQAVRVTDRDRPIICINEDLDTYISWYGESAVLALLDGQDQVDNIVWLATTNFPQRLEARIANRPSRFDERIFVGMPSKANRLAYLRSRPAVMDNLTPREIEQWADDTDGFSVAHIRELVVAVLCLEHPYPETLARLKGMFDRPFGDDGFGGYKRSIS